MRAQGRKALSRTNLVFMNAVRTHKRAKINRIGTQISRQIKLICISLWKENRRSVPTKAK